MSSVPPQLEASWAQVLEKEFQKPYMEKLKTFIREERLGPLPIFPPSEDVFNAFKYTPFNQVKAVIIGQDPYHGLGQAHGLCFSVQKGMILPPSLKNIFTELKNDLNIDHFSSGCLTGWAQQGVLLLNATLTVRQGKPLSHYGKGWEIFTDTVIQKLLKQSSPIAFLLWGKSAREKCQHFMLEKSPHLILTAAHPSPYSVQGFFECRHFSKTNQFLISLGKSPIDWSL